MGEITLYTEVGAISFDTAYLPWTDEDPGAGGWRQMLDAKNPREAGVVAPEAIEREYRRYLLGRLDRLRERILGELDDWLTEDRIESIDDRARQDSRRADATEGGDIASWSERMANVRLSWERERDVGEIRQKAEEVGAETNAFNREQQRRVFSDVVGIDPIDSPETKDLVDEFSARNVDLITGQDMLEDRALRQVTDETVKALQEGRRHEELAKQVEERLGVAESRAQLIARDQLASLNGQLTKVRHKRAGIERFEWQTSQDERVRPTHQALNGEVYSYENPPSEGLPGEPINCRCVAIPVFEDDGRETSEKDVEPTAKGIPPSELVQVPERAPDQEAPDETFRQAAEIAESAAASSVASQEQPPESSEE